jgi:hypothetical protein
MTPPISRNRKTKIACCEGWIYVTPFNGQRLSYYVTASGHRAMTLDPLDLPYVIEELIKGLGGLALR